MSHIRSYATYAGRLSVHISLPPSPLIPIHIGAYEKRGGRIHESGRYHRQLAVYTAVSKVDNLGLTACVLLMGSRIVNRNITQHGTALVETPAHLQEAAMLQSLRIAHDWYHQSSQLGRAGVEEVIIQAGNADTILALGEWARTGCLTLETPAASALAEDLKTIQEWLPVPLQIIQFRPPNERSHQDMPWVYRAIYTQLEEFRRRTSQVAKEEGELRTPCIPLTKTEIRQVLYAQLEADELDVMRQLIKVDSDSANTIL